MSILRNANAACPGQVRDKSFNAISVIYGIMVKADFTVCCHIRFR